jgi:hypothetical protein
VIEDAQARVREFAAQNGRAGERPQFGETERWLGAKSPRYCWPAGRGAWALLPDALLFYPVSSKAEYWGLDAHVVLAHIDESGKIAAFDINTLEQGDTSHTGWGELADANCCVKVGGEGFGPPLLYDFDRDGEDEIFLKASFYLEGTYEESVTLATFHNGGIEAYAPARKFAFREVTDVTKDGQPDLLVYEYLDGGESCGSGFPRGGDGPKFLVHGLPDGGFSDTDETAVAFARSWCPRAPRALKTPSDVVCAQLWGESADDLWRKVNKLYSPIDCNAMANNRPQKANASESYHFLVSATRVKVPFRLR